MDQPLEPGLYIVATPIGNLGDISLRAAGVLRGVVAVACEDTRVTGKLMRHLGVKQKLVRYDDHASEATRDYLLGLAAQQPIALVSDAGTPLISDPGYRLVRAARERGIAVTSLPGPSAAVVALTLAGLPSDRFLFAGFLPNKAKARADALSEVAGLRASLVFYESGPRLAAALSDMALALGEGREACVAREITKLHEEARTGTLSQLARAYAAADAPPKGEIVVVIGPPGEAPAMSADDADSLLREALERLSVGKAASEVAKATGLDRRTLYARALEIKAP